MQHNENFPFNFPFHIPEYISDVQYLQGCSAQRHKSSCKLYCAKSYSNTQRAFSHTPYEPRIQALCTGWKNMVTVTYIKIDILILHVLYKDRKINVTANKLNLLFIKFSHLFPNFMAEGTLEERFAIKTAVTVTFCISWGSSLMWYARQYITHR